MLMKDVIGTLVRDISRRAGWTADIGPRAGLAAAGLVAVLAFALLRPTMSTDVLIPFIATLLFLMACVALHFALRAGPDARSARLTYWDVSGLLTFAGICAAALIEPESVVQLIGTGDRAE
jgi:hypothetical protein